MTDYCVVTADGSRARFFCLNVPERPGVDPGPTLSEAGAALVNPDFELGERANFGDSKTGRGYSSSGAVHGYDDNRDDHMDEYKRRFAKRVAEQALQFAERNQCKQLVLAAERRMLGYLREAMVVPPKACFSVKELAKDVCRLDATELQAHLAGEGLVPARRRPM